MSVSGDEGTSEKKFQGGQMEGGGAQPPLKSTYLRKPSYIVIENNLLGKARLLYIRFIILIEDILLSVLRIKISALAAPTFDDMLSCLLVDFWGVDLLRSCFLTG